MFMTHTHNDTTRHDQEPALASMFERKYKNPEAYWREYPGWWAEWKDKLGEDDLSAGTVGFYSGDK